MKASIYWHSRVLRCFRYYDRFGGIRNNSFDIIARELKLEILSSAYIKISLFVPVFAALPLHFQKTMTLGMMMQARSAFGNVQDGLGWFVDYSKRLIELSAVIERVLRLVGLRELFPLLDEEREWGLVLSGGEQQRVGLARVLLTRPKILFLDEATNQLDEASALALMRVLKASLPDSLCLAVTHQTALWPLFDEVVDLERRVPAAAGPSDS